MICMAVLTGRADLQSRKKYLFSQYLRQSGRQQWAGLSMDGAVAGDLLNNLFH